MHEYLQRLKQEPESRPGKERWVSSLTAIVAGAIPARTKPTRSSFSSRFRATTNRTESASARPKVRSCGASSTSSTPTVAASRRRSRRFSSQCVNSHRMWRIVCSQQDTWRQSAKIPTSSTRGRQAGAARRTAEPGMVVCYQGTRVARAPDPQVVRSRPFSR